MLPVGTKDHINWQLRIAQAFQWIYENTPVIYPKTLIIDDGKDIYGNMM